MFDLFRSREKSVRILLGVLLTLVAASMLVYLIPGGLGGPDVSGENVVAVVGNEKITTQDLDRALERIQQGQTNLPKGLLAMYIPSIVNQMVDAKAMAYKARELGLRVSDQELGNSIASEFAAQLGGKFNMNIYKAVLQQQGITPAEFESSRREALLGARFEDLESQSIVVTDQEAKAEYQRKNLKVGLQYLDFDDKAFASKVNKDPKLVKAYFDKNRSLFAIPEKRDGDLIVGTLADFMQSANVSDSDLRQQYQDNIDSYRVPERVKVRHILIKTEGKPKSEVPQLKAKAEDILKQLQHGADFATLAKKNSEDPGSAEKGGELGWIAHGQTVANFEKAAFSLKPGQLSGLVETEYGFHIIQVEDKQEAHVRPFDEVKPELLAQVKKQTATNDLQKAMDAAHTEVTKAPTQAQAIARKYELKFFPLNGVVRTDSLPEVGNQTEVVSAIFATPKGAVSDVVNLDQQGKAAFSVVTNVMPTHSAQYAEVEQDVLQRYTTAESQRLTEEAAKNALASAKKGDSLEAIGKQYGIAVKTAAPFTIDGAAEGIGSATLMPQAFKQNVGDAFGPIAAQNSQFVCKITGKIPADMSQFEKNKNDVVQNLLQRRRGVQQPLFRESVVTELRRRGKVKYNQNTINRIVSAYQQS